MTGLRVWTWMKVTKIKATDIADEYGCGDGFVSRFLNGTKTSQGLVDHLVKKGCPKSYFENGKVKPERSDDEELQAD